MARFDLYKVKPYWWWYTFLALAAVKNSKKDHDELVEMVIDAVHYYDDTDVSERTKVKAKYNVKNG